MTAPDEIDTAALRALADAADDVTSAGMFVRLDPDTVRALCDAYDDSEGLVAQSRRVSELELEKRTRLRAALDAAQAEAERMRAILQARPTAVRAWNAEERAEKAEAQVAAVLALCDEAAPRRMGDGYLSASVLAPEDVRAAVEGAGDVPMSPDMGHDLRERIAQRIDQAWAEANDRRPRSEYRDGYLDGLEHAEAAARSTPLTMGGAS